jgi:ACS family glucarate transporter-like MFS transporter
MEPTRARNWVIVFAVTLAVITYFDRVCLSQAGPYIRKDLGLTPIQMGVALSAFAWAYALFEIPGGFLGDWLGPRKVLIRIVIWWSFFTAFTAFAFNQISLVVVQLLFGAGEAGCFPNLTKTFTIWLPREERVRAQGIMWLSARWGGAFTPLLVLPIIKFFNWRTAFLLFGSLGVIWVFFFWRWFRDHPKDHPSVNEAELELLGGPNAKITGHGSVPWGKFVASPTVWLMWLQYFCISYGWYFYITWLPTYLQDARHMDLGALRAVLAGFPLFCGGIGCFFSGMMLPWVTKVLGDPRKARRLMACVGCFSAGALLIVSSRQTDPIWAMVAMGAASFCNDLVMPPAWGACMEVGGRFAGTLSGSMNMMGNLGGAVSPIVVGFILSTTNQNWTMTFYISAAVYMVGMVAWMFIDPVSSLDTELSQQLEHA